MSLINNMKATKETRIRGIRILMLSSLLTTSVMVYLNAVVDRDDVINNRVVLLQAPNQTPTPLYYRSGDPIMNISMAISMTLTELPSGFGMVTPEARLVRYQTYRQVWLQEGMQQGEIGPDVPVWIVGAQKAGLTVGDTINIPGIGYGAVIDNRSAEGAYVAWHANEGRHLSAGALIQGEPADYASLVALPNEQLVVTRPTVQLVYP